MVNDERSRKSIVVVECNGGLWHTSYHMSLVFYLARGECRT